jgi:hypothetical protein
MKRLYIVFFALIFFAGTSFSQPAVQKTRYYRSPSSNLLDRDMHIQLESIRCVAAGDLNNDGKQEIVATDYTDGGHVHVFAPVGVDSFELVWSSPKVNVQVDNSSPRNVIIADLDNDGLKEIIYDSNRNGIYIYEWDGVAGSYNFGTSYSQLINENDCSGFTVTAGVDFYTEKMSAADLYGDGRQELVVSLRSTTTAEQKYMIISAVGDWATNDPGFSSFNMDYVGARPDLGPWGLGGGSATAMMAANLDGTGPKEVILHAYNYGDVSVLRYDGSKWALPDTSTHKQNLYLYNTDGVSYFGGIVDDIDNDGRDEVYLPTNVSSDTSKLGKVVGICYDSPSTPTQIDSTNTFEIDFSNITKAAMWGYGHGDIDGNGKPNLYFTTAELGHAILSAEFEGGDKKNPDNWKTSVLYYGDSTAYSMTIKDSLGHADTSVVYDTYFPSKIFAQGTDVDGDGKEDIVAGYQPWLYTGTRDSISVTTLTWNSSLSKFDSSTATVYNPKRYSFVMLEKSTSTGVEAHTITFITPDDYQLDQNFPNPFNPTTTISFSLPLNKKITLAVYDMLGRDVRTLINNEEYVKGKHSVVWDGKNNKGQAVASGTYIYRMKFGNFEQAKKMLLLK